MIMGAEAGIYELKSCLAYVVRAGGGGKLAAEMREEKNVHESREHGWPMVTVL